MIGIFSKTTDSNFVEAAGISGLDFIILDQEHGVVSNEKLHDHIRAARITNMMSIVRVKELNHNAIGSALDAGADGVQIPNISNVEEARFAIESARYNPKGKRGVCRFVKAASFGMKDRNQYFQSENEKVLILQIEGVEGINNIDSIIELDGFDVLFIGPYDLSQSMGFIGQIEHPDVLKSISAISEKAKFKGKLLGTFVDQISAAKTYRNMGFEYLAYSVDVNIFALACSALTKSIVQ